MGTIQDGMSGFFSIEYSDWLSNVSYNSRGGVEMSYWIMCALLCVCVLDRYLH